MFKIIWDKENNGVLLTMKSSDETLNVPPRPVFFEELYLLGMDKYWNYPKSKEPLLWACDRWYFYCGEQVLEARFKSCSKNCFRIFKIAFPSYYKS